MSVFKDELGKWSAGRVLLFFWTALTAWTIIFHLDDAPAGILSLESAIEIALIGWNAGSRIAQYLLPQMGSVASAISNGIISKFTKISTEKVESVVGNANDSDTDESLASTDLSDFSQRG